MPGDLDGGNADGARRSDDQDLVAAFDPRLVTQERKSRHAAEGQRRRLLEGQVGGLEGNCPVFAHRTVFSMAAEGPAGEGNHFVPGPEPCHVRPYGFDDPCQFSPQNRLPRSEESEDQTAKQPETDRHVEASGPPVGGRHRGGEDADQDFIWLRRWLRDLVEANDIGAAILAVGHGFHSLSP